MVSGYQELYDIVRRRKVQIKVQKKSAAFGGHKVQIKVQKNPAAFGGRKVQIKVQKNSAPSAPSG